MQRRVVQAKIQYYRGKDDECRASLESLDAEGKLWSPASHDESSYGQVLVVQARCLFGKAAARGLYSLRYSCRHLFRIIAALLWGTVDAYSKLLKSIYAAPPALPRLLCEQNETTAWVEEALYRACFSLYDGWRSAATKSRRAFRDACTDAFRLYLEWASFQSFDYRPLKRISVLRNYIFHLALTCRCWNYRSPAMVLTTTTDSEDTAVANAEPPFVPRSLNEELSLLLALYESIVTSTISFPRADSPNQVVENLYDDITFIYCLFGFHESPASLANAATSQYELLLEAYFRATGRTFRSRSVMRRIGWTATLAEALEEAMMGFKMYLEKDKKDKRGEWWMRDPEEMAGETMDQVVGVLIAVTRMCLESLQVGGGSHGGACDERIVQSSPTQTQSAVIYAEKAVDLCRDAIGPSDSVYLPLSLYYLGITYSRLGIETLEHEHFHLLQEQSLIMLLEAERLDPNYWRFHYNLALQYEEMGLIKMAIGHAKTCIRLNYKHIPSWHLLAILTVASSDRGFSEYEIAMKALRVCTTAAEALASGRNISAKRLRDLDIYLSPGNKEEWLNLKMTEALLQEILLQNNLIHNKPTSSSLSAAFADTVDQLPQNVFDSYRRLFDTYSRIYYPDSGGDHDNAATVASKTTIDKGSHYRIDNVKRLMPLSDILKDLTTDNYPPLQSFFISSTPYSDPNSYNYTTPFTPTTSQSHSQPLRRVRFLRRRKLRYMEIWLQMAQVFRRLDKIHDARMACLEAQRVERGNADVEFELGMIALFNIAKPAIQSKTELPFTLDEERTVDGDNTHESMSARLPSTFYFSQDIEHKIPQEFSPFLVPHSPRASAIDLDAMRRYEQTRLAPSLAADSPLSMAVQHFLAALTMDDEHLPARTWLGRCYWQQGRYELARVELERAAKGGRIRGRKVWAAWHQLGLAYQSLGEQERASECLQIALEHEVSSVPLTNMRGYEVLPRCV